jgi:hypothetical protein
MTTWLSSKRAAASDPAGDKTRGASAPNPESQPKSPSGHQDHWERQSTDRKPLPHINENDI